MHIGPISSHTSQIASATCKGKIQFPVNDPPTATSDLLQPNEEALLYIWTHVLNNTDKTLLVETYETGIFSRQLNIRVSEETPQGKVIHVDKKIPSNHTFFLDYYKGKIALVNGLPGKGGRWTPYDNAPYHFHLHPNEEGRMRGWHRILNETPYDITITTFFPDNFEYNEQIVKIVAKTPEGNIVHYAKVDLHFSRMAVGLDANGALKFYIKHSQQTLLEKERAAPPKTALKRLKNLAQRG